MNIDVTRKILFSAVLVLSAFCGVATDWGGISRYAAANEQLATMEDPDRVVLLGNSITDNWPKFRPEFFTSNGLVGRGISGHTSYQFLVRFREDVVNLKPLAVVINAGTNDVAENQYPFLPQQTLGNIKSMVELARANNIKVILTSVLPADHFGWRKEMTGVAEKVQKLNDLIHDYAEAEGIPYVDYHSLMVNPGTGGMRAGLSSDGVHPNADGYAIMEAAILPVITKIRQKNK